VENNGEKRGGVSNLNKGGTKGNKGGPGRPPNWFKAELAKVLDRANAAQVVQDIIEGKKGNPADRLRAIQFAHEATAGKPTQPIELPAVMPVLVIRRDDSPPKPDEGE
jgi:hypothetical protein